MFGAFLFKKVPFLTNIGYCPYFLDEALDISISIRPMITKFGSTGFDSNETNQAGAGNVIPLGSRDKLKTCLHYQSAYVHQTWQDGNLPWWASGHKVALPFDHVVLQDHVTN